jgi:hypothetical protein
LETSYGDSTAIISFFVRLFGKNLYTPAMSIEIKGPRFIEAAKNYCAAVEAPEKMYFPRLLSIREALVVLYGTTLSFPDFFAATREDLPFEPSFDERVIVEDTILACTGIDCFWQCYEPFKVPVDAPVCFSLSDNLVQIWHALKPGLVALEEDEHYWRANVFWAWKHSFCTYWSDCAVDSIYAIHKLLRDAHP